jgi:hypothetical protein
MEDGMIDYLFLVINCAMLAMNMFMAHLLTKESAVNLEIAKTLFAAAQEPKP